MSEAEIASARKLSSERSEEDVVRMAVDCVSRGRLIGLWLSVSCLVPLAVLVAPALRPGIMEHDFWLWLAAMTASMTLPLPAREAGRRCARRGNVIAYAYWLKKDPSRLLRE